jgi:hypothetical protein
MKSRQEGKNTATVLSLGVRPTGAAGKRRHTEERSTAGCTRPRLSRSSAKDAQLTTPESSLAEASQVGSTPDTLRSSATLNGGSVAQAKSKNVDLFCYEEMDDTFVGFKYRAAHGSQPDSQEPRSSAYSTSATAPKGKRGFLSMYGDLSEVGAPSIGTGRHTLLTSEDLEAVTSKLFFSGGAAAEDQAKGKSVGKPSPAIQTPLARYPMDWSVKKSARITSSAPLDWVVEYRNKRTVPSQHLHTSIATLSSNSESQASRAKGPDTAPSKASELCCQALLQVCVCARACACVRVYTGLLFQSAYPRSTPRHT